MEDGAAKPAESKTAVKGVLEKEGEENEVSNDQDAAKTEATKKEAVFAPPTFVAPKRIIAKQKKGSKEDLLIESKRKDVENCAQSNDDASDSATVKKTFQVPFKPPSWCSVCSKNYSFEILKGGVIKGEVDLTNQPFYVFGRLEGCDVMMEHPSISRFHAVVVYKGPCDDEENKDSKFTEGFYIMDFGSTHGTVVNKIQLKPKVYHRLRVGYVVKFGGSTRLHILQGPHDDQDEETEMIINPNKATKKLGGDEDHGSIENENEEDEEGISWGMAEDAMEEEMDLEKLIASRKPLELKDPKKTLRGFFEREGLELEYESDEKGTGISKVFVIRVRLPIEDASGEEIIAEGTSAKKKEAVVACAYEACRIIDAHGMLRNAVHESETSKRAKRLAENDFYDSDDDSFLDRTGSVESKRRKRMKKAGKAADEAVETYESLKEALENCQQEIKKIEVSLKDDNFAEQHVTEEGRDDLDDFMSLVSKRLDKKTRISMKHRLAFLRKEERRIQRLLDIVKPTELPTLKISRPEEKLQTTTSAPVKECPDEIEGATKRDQSRKSESPMINVAAKSEDESPITEQKRWSKGADSSVVNIISRINPSGTGKESAKRQRDENAKQRKSQKKKVYGPQLGPSTDSKFADWVPPENQSGDGKTHLNEKFGY